MVCFDDGVRPEEVKAFVEEFTYNFVSSAKGTVRTLYWMLSEIGRPFRIDEGTVSDNRHSSWAYSYSIFSIPVRLE